MKIWRPYTQMHNAAKPGCVLKASGAHLYLANGQKILDGISSWWVITHGHAHPEIVEAIALQAGKVDQVVFANFTHEKAEHLVELLQQFLPPRLDCVFFSDNGSTSIEVAMKMAYQYCLQSGKSERSKFLTFNRAYHGDTCGAMSVSSDSIFTRSYKGLRFEVLRCSQGAYSFDPIDDWLQDFRHRVELHHEELAAVIIEPCLQGAGGMIVWPPEAVKEIGQICRDNGILLIFDEALTGFARCGSMFAFEKVGVIPDLLCLSKGLTGGTLPLALTVTTSDVYEAFLSSRPEKMFFHGHSFTGNAISCAAAVANLNLFRDGSALARVQAIERAHYCAINTIKNTVVLKDFRILGAVGAIELETQSEYGDGLSQKIFSDCLDAGLYIRPLGNILYLMPPFHVDLDELQQAWYIVAKACHAHGFGR